MADFKASSSKLVIACSLEPKDELDEKLEKSFSLLLGITKDLSDREANDTLQAFISRGSTQHDDIQLGYFYAILTDPTMSAKNYRDMTLVSQDGLSKIIVIANQLIYEKWIKFTDMCRTQMLWFTKELVRNSVVGSDSICHSLVRQISGGDLSQKNVWLTETLLDIFVENRFVEFVLQSKDLCLINRK